MSTISQNNPVQKKINSSGLTVLITGSIMQLFLGILYVWSVFVRPVSEVFSWQIDSVKLTSSFMLCFFVVGIIAGGKLHLKFGSDKVVLGGGLLLAAGMLATAFLPQEAAWLMYITYGIIGGFGVGSAYNAIICAAQKWFPQKRGLATGIVVCAFGLSTVIFAPLIKTLIETFELRNTFLILSGAFFIATVALFRFIRLPDEAGSPSSANPAAAALLAKKQYVLTETIKTKQYYLIALSLAVATAPFFILNPSFITYADVRGVPEFGTIIVMMTGVANACGRLTVPLLSDRIGREKAALTVLLVTSVCALFLTIAQGFVFITAVLTTAFCFGGLPGLYAVMASDYFGIKNAGANYGAIMMGFALSALIFPVFIGMIQNDTMKFITLSVMAAGGALLIILLIASKKKFEELNV
ncbi:MAG: MFS transporter [Treponema sp.]|nr:MFS transporter [Treponema sp.]MCL2271822.1 MFS transporter [Treponema sp.]